MLKLLVSVRGVFDQDRLKSEAIGTAGPRYAENLVGSKRLES